MREAIHGTYKTNFVMSKQTTGKGGMPLGTINDGVDAQEAIFARGQSSASIQFVNDELKLMNMNSSHGIPADVSNGAGAT